ncbi:hypothetical protein ABINADI_40 [Bacillus phage vB_BanH_Abinadi]|nr:hypothetical protein ABINADI_40 [Bacillus phage vB_BanH_Abinadi]
MKENQIQVQDKYYLMVLEAKVQDLTKENLVAQALVRQLMEENQNLIEMYNAAQNKAETTEESKGEKEGE